MNSLRFNSARFSQEILGALLVLATPWCLLVGHACAASDLDWYLTQRFGASDARDILNVNGRSVVVATADGVLHQSRDNFWNVTSLSNRPLNRLALRGERVFVVGDAGDVADTEDLSHWTRRTVAGENLTGVSISRNSIVLTGEAGQLLRSTDGGVSWIAQETSQTYNDVSFGQGKFVAVGQRGAVGYTFDDGTNSWVETQLTANNLHRIQFMNGSFWIAGSNGTVLRSTDAVSWTREELPDPTCDLHGIALAGERIAAVGIKSLRGVPTGCVFYRRNSTSEWNAVTPAGTPPLRAITAYDGGFLGVGDRGALVMGIPTDDPLNSWTQQDMPRDRDVTSIAKLETALVAVGDRAIFFNTNGLWKEARIDGATDSLVSFDDVAAGNGRFVAVGSHMVFASSNLADWKSVFGAAGHAVAFGNGEFVSGFGLHGVSMTIITSPDGVAWSGTNYGIPAESLAIAYGAGKFAGLFSGFGEYIGQTVGSANEWDFRRGAAPVESAITYGLG
jgi:photosystem II stability/assembly factor-like uncharacterized protein